MSSSNTQTRWGQFIPLVTVFFFWGFVAASNDILIPVFEDKFDLEPWQSQMVSFAFYIAYTVGSLLYIAISSITKRDIVERLGYKNSLSLGLTISAVGAVLFYPAAEMNSFPLMLTGLFVVALGFSLQQTVANPLAIALGPIQTGSQRLTLAGGINNFGTTIGPLLVSLAIFGSVSAPSENVDINTVKVPYLILAGVFLLVAIFLKLSSLPNHPETIEEDVVSDAAPAKKSALQYPQLLMGMFAIFLYVGVEVSTASNLPAYLKELGFATSSVAPYVSLYWASLMIGRWGGAVEAFTNDVSLQKILKIVAPYLAFGVFLGVNTLIGHDVAPFYIYAAIIVVLIVADFASKGNPATMLMFFSILGIIALIIGMLTEGNVSIFAFTSVGLFCSTLWPCIFTLAVSGLGKQTTQGSTFLIMMIMGGGFISIAQGYLAGIIGMQASYIVGVVCFAYLAFYAITVKGILTKQGINFDKVSGGGH
ncbi:MFS transporter [Flavobacterium akiainvivens]|uniref:MFS transporter n=1 Tax=Flavobacterium akiainvivens TaxID=1202724 RepID=A0A0M8MEZ1_9FLAO|nr:MFS transporter [Flavobacterium akiainvivens]KOS04861.1 MFS transporter [Flavobacterium akiainvivens]SFQ43085.1 MFS transporter, FHS family, L-fucose permease [Flavobacterium akiainvivens]